MLRGGNKTSFACKAAKCKPDMCQMISQWTTDGECVSGVFFPGMVASWPEDKDTVLKYMAETGDNTPGGVQAVKDWINAMGNTEGLCSTPGFDLSIGGHGLDAIAAWKEDEFFADLMVYPHYAEAIVWGQQEPPIAVKHSQKPYLETVTEFLADKIASILGYSKEEPSLCQEVEGIGAPKKIDLERIDEFEEVEEQIKKLDEEVDAAALVYARPRAREEELLYGH